MASSESILKKKNSKEKDKKDCENRKKEVSTVKGRIPDACDANITEINKKIDKISEKLTDALKGISGVDTLTGQFEDKKEKASNIDSFLSNYAADLDSEMADCDARISELETDISNLQKDYENAKAAEEAQAANS